MKTIANRTNCEYYKSQLSFITNNDQMVVVLKYAIYSILLCLNKNNIFEKIKYY